MSDEIEKTFLNLCKPASHILVLQLNFKSKDLVLNLDLDMDVQNKDIDYSYWGRPCHGGYNYQVYRI